MRILYQCVLIICFSSSSWVAQAQTLVLVPGFQSQGMDWRTQGVTPVLQQYAWVDAGNLVVSAQGVVVPFQFSTQPAKVFYTVELPTKAPLWVQAAWLEHYLQAIYHWRQEPLTLVGHSVGGLVARTWLVRSNSVPVDTLISIASPHLGSVWADLAYPVARLPLGWFSDMMGVSVLSKDAKGVLRDLRRAAPGRFLYWLNQQPHPAIRYVSLVRNNQWRPDQFDYVVPSYSQNMNRVWALQGRAEVWPIQQGHFLTSEDAYILAYVLQKP